MKVFLSWSGNESNRIALALHDWLPLVLTDVEAWVSSHDIKAGARWGADLMEELAHSEFGILCLTPENLLSPWVLYEAGAISKGLGGSRILPYRRGVTAADLGGPLSQFQGVDADEEGSFDLVRGLNDARDPPVDESRLARIFEQWWPKLADDLSRIDQDVAHFKTATDREVLEDILGDMRRVARNTEVSAADTREMLAASLLLQEGWGVAELAADSRFTQMVVEWSRTAKSPEELLLNLPLNDVARLAGFGYKMPEDLRPLLSLLGLSGDLGSGDHRDLTLIGKRAQRAGALATPYLARALTSGNAAIRAHAAHLIGGTGDPRGVQYLLPLLEDAADLEWPLDVHGSTVGAIAQNAIKNLGADDASDKSAIPNEHSGGSRPGTS